MVASQNRFLGYGRQAISEEDIEAVVQVLRGDLITQGPMVPAFESALAESVGARYAVAVSSGTAGLHIACLAAGLTAGDRGVTQDVTFIASANCMLYCGAAADVIDIDPASCGMCPDALSVHLRTYPETKVVVPVHFAGLAGNMARIREIAGDRCVIEDASHALGGTYANDRPVGCGDYSDMAVFSFHPVKPITTCEGGAVVTNDEDLYRRLQMLRNHGIARGSLEFRNPEEAYEGARPKPWYYEQQQIGFNYRLNDLQAALGLSQLRRLSSFRARRRDIARRYDAAFADVPGIEIVQGGETYRSRSAHHLYVLWFDFAAIASTRTALFEWLSARQVGCQVHYIPVHKHPVHMARGIGGPDRYPAAECYYRGAVSLPLHPGLSEADVDRVIEAVIGFVQR